MQPRRKPILRGFSYGKNRRRWICRTDPRFPAGIRAARTSFPQGRSTARNTKPCIRKRSGQQQDEVITAAGERQVRSFYSFIHCVRSACGKASQLRQRLWTTSYRTEETRSSSGIGATGRHYAKNITTRRQESSTADRNTSIEKAAPLLRQLIRYCTALSASFLLRRYTQY